MKDIYITEKSFFTEQLAPEDRTRMRRLEIIGMGLRCVDIVMSCTEMPTWGKGSFVDLLLYKAAGRQELPW